jgi:predicted transcriptional regulator of viral defense system
MKKYNQLTTKYIISALFEKRFYYFDIKLFKSLFNLKIDKAKHVLYRISKQGYILSGERGKYFLLGFEPYKILSDPFFIATHLIQPSYVSFWSALNFYSLTEQAPATVFVACTRRSKTIKFKNKFRFKIIKIKPSLFWGYEKHQSEDYSFLIASPEKAIIDSLYLPQYAGGFLEAAKAITNYLKEDEKNLPKLVEYAILTKNKSLCSRLGFLLEQNRAGSKNLAKLKKHISDKTLVKLDPLKPKTKKYNRQWNIIINRTNNELFDWQYT